MGPSLTPPPHPHRRGARPMRIESDNYPRLEKGFQLCWQLSFETVQTCRDFVLLSFTVLCVYIYVYIYIYICQ